MSRGRAVRAGAAVGAARIVSLVAAAAQLPILARVLDADEFANASLAIAAATYFALVSAEPHALPFQRFPGTTSDRSPYAIALRRSALTAVAVAAVAIAGGAAVGSLEVALGIAGWGAGLAFARLAATAWLSWHAPWRYAGTIAGSTIVRTIVLLVLVTSGAGIGIALLAAGLASAIAAVLLGPWSTRGTRTRIPAPWSVRFGIRLAAASAMYTVLMSIALLVMPLASSPAAVADFAGTSQLVALTIGSVHGLVITAAYPSARAAWDEGARARALRWIGLGQVAMMLVATAGAVALTAGDGWASRLVLGPVLQDLSVVGPVAAGTGFAAVGMLQTWRLQFELRAAEILQRSTISAIVGVASALTMTLTVGDARAASLGFAAGFACYALAMMIDAQPSWSTITIVGLAGAALVAGAFLPHEAIWIAASAASVLLTISLARRAMAAR